MTSVQQIIGVIIFSAVLLGGIAWWVESKNAPTEALLEDVETLDGPLTTEELTINNQEITNPMNRIATFSTNKGDIKIELFEDLMPITTGNFISLATEGFYDGTKFHRVIDGFMIQAGDPNSKGTDPTLYGRGGPGYTIEDEFVEGEFLTNTRGTIAMANTGQPNSGGSQFFINTVDNVNLDFNKPPFTSKHPVFGRVIDGMDVVDAISKVETGVNDLPLQPVVIESITISVPEEQEAEGQSE